MQRRNFIKFLALAPITTVALADRVQPPMMPRVAANNVLRPCHAYSVGDVVHLADGTQIRCVAAGTSGPIVDPGLTCPVAINHGTSTFVKF